MTTRVTEGGEPTAIGLAPALRRRWLAWPVNEFKRTLEGPIVRNAAALYGATVVTSLLGFIYWFVAARLVPAQAVGIASAVQSAGQFLGYFCVIGLNTLVISELSVDKQHARSLMLTAVASVGVVSLVLSAVVGVGLQSLSSAIRAGVHGPVGLLVFILLGSVTTMLLVLDDACIGLLRGDLQLKRNAVFAVTKLALLPVLIWAWASQSGIELVVAWLAGLIISFMTLGLQLGKQTSGQGARLEFRRLFEKRRLMFAHHWLNLSIQAPRLLLPVLVVLILGARANAAFTAAFLVVGFINVIPSQLSTVLFALAPGDEAALRHQVRKTMRICRLLSVASAAFFLLFAGLILSAFGHDYKRATTALIILGLTTYPQSIKAHFVAIARVRGRMQQAAFRATVGAFLEVGLAAAGAHIHGLTGLAMGFLIATVIEAVFFSPSVFGVLRAAHTPTRRAAVASGPKRRAAHAAPSRRDQRRVGGRSNDGSRVQPTKPPTSQTSSPLRSPAQHRRT
jgi:O-antigen/teichoic acid export membrane protein